MVVVVVADGLLRNSLNCQPLSAITTSQPQHEGNKLSTSHTRFVRWWGIHISSSRRGSAHYNPVDMSSICSTDAVVCWDGMVSALHHNDNVGSIFRWSHIDSRLWSAMKLIAYRVVTVDLNLVIFSETLTAQIVSYWSEMRNDVDVSIRIPFTVVRNWCRKVRRYNEKQSNFYSFLRFLTGYMNTTHMS